MVFPNINIIHGYYWLQSNDYHFVPTLSELIQQVGRRESNGLSIQAFSTNISETGSEIVNSIYDSKNPGKTYLQINVFGQTKTIATMSELYYIIGRALLSHDDNEIEISYFIEHPISTSTGWAPETHIIVIFKKPELQINVSWFTEGF